MDHPHYAYRARLANTTAAPGPHPVQAFVLLVLEHWDAEAGEQGLRDPRFVGEFGSFSPDYRSWTQREYGLRIGVFRVLEALAEVGIIPPWRRMRGCSSDCPAWLRACRLWAWSGWATAWGRRT